MAVEQQHEEPPPLAEAKGGVGSLLRQARESRGQDVEAVARALRIRHPYILAIEEGRHKDLPGAPYSSGFVRSYAEFLGLDSDEILRRFRDETGGQVARTELVFPAPVSDGGFPAAALIALVIILAAIIYGVWYFYQWRHGANADAVSDLPDRLAALIHAPGGDDRPPPAAAAEAPSPRQATAAPAPSPVATAAANPAATPLAEPAAPAPAPPVAPVTVAAAPPAPSTPSAPAVPATPVSQTASPAADPPKPETVVADATPAPAQTPPPVQEPSLGANRVVLRANDDCWIEIRDSTGAIVVSRLMRRGESFPVPTRPGLTLTVGNASALTLLLDGRALPPLGRTGMVRHEVPLDPDRLAGAMPAGPAND